MRILAALGLVAIVGGCRPSGPLFVPLHYGPTSALQVQAVGGAVAQTRFQLGQVRDERTVEHTLVGENREDKEPVPVQIAAESAVETTRSAVLETFKGAGLQLAATGDVRLDVDVVELWVEETNLYRGVARLRVTVTRAGEAPAVVIVDGSSKRFGSSLSAENYNETISDALLHAMEHLLSLPAFEAAVSGAAAQVEPPASSPPASSTSSQE